jgi:F420-0:gamma-glutamyl ligase-like protein
MSVEIETSQNYAIGERRWSDEYRLPPGGAVLVIVGLSHVAWGVILGPLFAIFRQ